jgi:hypothetical protein
MVTVILHTISVLVTEIRAKNGLVSAKLTGEKVFYISPIDKRLGESVDD